MRNKYVADVVTARRDTRAISPVPELKLEISESKGIEPVSIQAGRQIGLTENKQSCGMSSLRAHLKQPLNDFQRSEHANRIAICSQVFP